MSKSAVERIYKELHGVIGKLMLKLRDCFSPLLAIVVYRLPWTWKCSKLMMKLIHAGLNVLAFILAVISLVAVFDFHNVQNIPNMYSLHSWVGLIAVILFSLQVTFLCLFVFFCCFFIITFCKQTRIHMYMCTVAEIWVFIYGPLFVIEQIVLGLCIFLLPVSTGYLRAAFLPIHVFSGLFIFTTVIATALMGITEKLIFGL